MTYQHTTWSKDTPVDDPPGRATCERDTTTTAATEHHLDILFKLEHT